MIFDWLVSSASSSFSSYRLTGSFSSSLLVHSSSFVLLSFFCQLASDKILSLDPAPAYLIIVTSHDPDIVQVLLRGECVVSGMKTHFQIKPNIVKTPIQPQLNSTSTKHNLSLVRYENDSAYHPTPPPPTENIC